MRSIADYFVECNDILRSIDSFVRRYIGNGLLRKCGITKIVDDVTEEPELEYHDNPIARLIGDKKDSKFLEKIVSAAEILKDKLVVCFFPGSSYQMFKTNTFFGGYKKDTFYRFDTRPQANWERLHLETARNVIMDIESETTKTHSRALVFDDSLYQRTGGKGTDLCAKVFDHNDCKLRLGYRMMTGGWTNGELFVPFSQCLLTTRNEKLMVGPDEHIDGRTLRGKRRALAKEKGTVVVQKMVEMAKKAEIPFDYVMFDTWFSNPSQICALRKLDTHVIAMVKKNSTKYICTDPATGEDIKLDIKEIYSRNKKRRGRSKYLLSVDVRIPDGKDGSIPVKLVYARNRNNRKDWVCFVCTNMQMAEEAVLQAYTMRWSIETYFKMCKSYLKLRTECHSPNYDVITAHMVIVAIRYMVLVVERFRNTDNRSVQDLFYGVQREIMDKMIGQAVVTIIDALLSTVQHHFHISDEQMMDLLRDFVDNLPKEWKCRFSLPDSPCNAA